MPAIRISSAEQLLGYFRRAEKPAERFRVGLEAEKLGLHLPSLAPAQYDGPSGIREVLGWMQSTLGWDPVTETPDGPLLALKRAGASITLEPGAQFELSGAPFDTVHRVVDEYEQHLSEMAEVRARFGVGFSHLGFHPLARLDELPWVPKRRYPVMRDYLPMKGPRGLDMMQRTATVQVNLDYASEADAMRKLRTLLRLTPLLQALTLHSPYIEGKRSSRLSERLDVWLNMDPARSGLIQQLWSVAQPSYEDYVQWALDAGMFLVVRDGQVIANTGQTFRDFAAQGFGGTFATEDDWALHLGTLFPEVRLKSTIEVRCCDALPPDLAPALPALCVGLMYDEQALDRAEEIAARVPGEGAVALQREVCTLGLDARLDGEPVQRLCLQLLEAARSGLVRRARLDAAGRDESRHLDGLAALTERGLTPAHAWIERVERAGSLQQALLATLTHP
jgi:glutamate--cysteine ligase